MADLQDRAGGGIFGNGGEGDRHGAARLAVQAQRPAGADHFVVRVGSYDQNVAALDGDDFDRHPVGHAVGA